MGAGTIHMPPPEATGAGYFDLAAALSALDSGAPLRFPPFEIIRTRIDGRDYTFCANFERDPIQNAHRAGAFFEAEDLARLKAAIPPRARVLDVGANVGNHAIFLATQCAAASVIVIEPNPLALAPLVANVVLNGLDGVIRMEALGIGLAATSETGLAMKRHDRNLGATKMLRGKGGAMSVHAGDDLFADECFELIKIDVEGMEMEVLAGLEQTITRCRPLLFIEVDDSHLTAFRNWADHHGYRTLFEARHSKKNMNIALQPIGGKA